MLEASGNGKLIHKVADAAEAMRKKARARQEVHVDAKAKGGGEACKEFEATRRKADIKNWSRCLRATRRQAEIIPKTRG